MTTPVDMYFYSKYLPKFRKVAAANLKEKGATLRDIIHQYVQVYDMELFTETAYGFEPHLRTGIYTPTPGEQCAYNIGTYNCTTVIPEVYTIMEAHNLQPQIIQFVNFRYRKSKHDHEPVQNTGHFALVVNMEGKEHLVDPYQRKYGEIVRKEEHCWRIRGHKDYPSTTLEFETMLHPTQEEFATLLYNLREPANSLDMLVGGQKIWDDAHKIGGVSCTLHVFYADHPPTLTTRLWVPQFGMSDQFVFCEQPFDVAGTPLPAALTLSFGTNHTWTDIIDKTVAARTDFTTMQRIKEALSGIDLEKKQRVGRYLEGRTDVKRDLTNIAEEQYRKLYREEAEALQARILVRTLYEAAHPQEEYVYDEKERGNAKFLRDYRAIIDKMIPFQKRLWETEPHPPVSQREKRRVQRAIDRLAAKSATFNVKTFIGTGDVYQRALDKVRFVEQYEKADIPELLECVRGQGLDWRIGYLAMIADFVPYVLATEDGLLLTDYREDLHRRILARVTI